MKPRIQISIPREEEETVEQVSYLPSKEMSFEDRNFPINKECTSLGIYQDAFVLAGFCDGTVRIFDIHDAFAKPNGEDELQRPPFVDSNLYQSYGAVACQIHAKGVHTNLRTELKVAGDYCFASVVRGSMECVAIRLDALKATGAPNTNILDAITVTRHSDAKLRGLTHATQLSNGSYLLLAGKAIKNLHIWRFTPDQWECLYDKPTNGNTIQWSTTIGTSVVSKSEGQCIRVWNIPSLYDATMDPPAKLSYYDMIGTESALAVAKDWKLYSTGVFCPGHLKVHTFETDESSHLSIVPQAGASRRHYASVERVVVTDGGIVMAIVSDGSVWCGISSLEKIASGATAGQVSQHWTVVATGNAIECRVLPWKKKQAEEPKCSSASMIDPQLKDTVPLKDTVKISSNETHPEESSNIVPVKFEGNHSIDATQAEIATEQHTTFNVRKRTSQVAKSIKKPKKKPRILLKNILNANATVKTPTHRPIAPVVTDSKMDDELVQTVPQPIATPCIETPVHPVNTYPVIPRKRSNHHTCTPRKLECPAAEEALVKNPIETHDSDTITAEQQQVEQEHSPVSDGQPQFSCKSQEAKPKKHVHRTTTDRKQQLRARMCRRQMRLIDTAVRQLSRTEENYVRSRILLTVRRTIQDVLIDGRTVASQRAILEHEILPAFRKNIVIPWQLRCELETLKPVDAFDESVFVQALGYLEAIEFL